MGRFIRSLIDMSAERIVIVAFAIGGAFLGAWFVAVLIIAVIYATVLGRQLDLWGALEGMSSAATLASVIGGGVMALLQLVEAADNRKKSNETRNMDVYSDVFQRMMSEDNIEARRWIYTDLNPDPREGLGSISKDGQAYVKRVLNEMDYLGFMLKHDWVTGDEIIQWVSPMVVKLWAKIGPYVDYEAQRRNEPDYYEAARELAMRSARWRRDNVPGGADDIIWLNDAL